MLTLSEHKTHEFILNFVQKFGFSPTISEVARGIGIKSRGVAHRYLKILEKKGYIRLLPKRHRNIQIPNVHRTHQIPLLGVIAAGLPIDALQQMESLEIHSLFKGENRFALRVKGNSMIDENIVDGDIIICERREPEQQDIAVILIDKEQVTLKRLKKNADRTVTLIPANTDYESMTYDGDRIEIQGIYIGLLRMSSQKNRILI